MPAAELEKLIANLEAEMFAAADQLKFEYAAKLRDEIKELSRASCRGAGSWPRERPRPRAGHPAGRRMTTVDLSVKALAGRAVELGAAAARPLSAREVVVDPRVRLKCSVPRCSGYGRNLMCPPFVPTPDEFARRARPLRRTRSSCSWRSR